MRLVFGPGGRRRNPVLRDPAGEGGRQGHHDARRTARLVRTAAETAERPRAASLAAGRHRRTGDALRLLLQRDDRQRGRTALQDAPAERRPDSHGDERPSVPVWHLSAGAQGHSARRGHDGGRWAMTRVTRVSSATAFPRREFLKAGGALLIGFTASPRARAQQADLLPGDLAPGPAQPDPDQIDTWIAIHADNSATVFIGHVDLGQGIATTMLQIAAEELDLGMDQVKTVRLETGKGPNQGNTGASSGISRGGPRGRLAA